jgi:hypothetical protein
MKLLWSNFITFIDTMKKLKIALLMLLGLSVLGVSQASWFTDIINQIGFETRLSTSKKNAVGGGPMLFSS